MAQFSKKTRRGIDHLLANLKEQGSDEAQLSNIGSRKLAGHPIYRGLSMPERKELLSLLTWLASKRIKEPAVTDAEVDEGLKAATSTSQPMPGTKPVRATKLTPTGHDTSLGN